jgi:hypothetical protein
MSAFDPKQTVASVCFGAVELLGEISRAQPLKSRTSCENQTLNDIVNIETVQGSKWRHSSSSSANASIMVRCSAQKQDYQHQRTRRPGLRTNAGSIFGWRAPPGANREHLAHEGRLICQSDVPK